MINFYYNTNYKLNLDINKKPTKELVNKAYQKIQKNRHRQHAVLACFNIL